MERRKDFQRLKTNCVELIQAATNLDQQPNAKKAVVLALTNLLLVLREITTKPDSLDPKLAEFVFVPISQVFRASRVAPVRALELSLECLIILLRTGWKGNLSPELSGQLLVLLTFLATPSSTENGIPATSEELQAAAFRCMASLLMEMTATHELRNHFTDTENIPSISKAVLVTVDSLIEAPSNDVKLEALGVIEILSSRVDDKEALASFLPRIVSSMTKMLTPSSSNRVGFRILEKGLETLSVLLISVLNDRETASLPSDMTISGAPTNRQRVLRTGPWLQATASQVKIALANVLKLRHHDKDEVRQALLQLCTKLVQECRKSLSECTSMLVETMVSLASDSRGQSASEDTLNVLLSSDGQLASLLRESLHGWIISLPRLIQTGDDHERRQIIHQISIAIRLLDYADLDISRIDSLLANNLQDSIASLLKDNTGAGHILNIHSETASTTSILKSHRSLSFPSLKLRSKGQDDIMHEFKALIQQLAKSNSASVVARDLVNTAEAGSPEMQTATLWLSVTLLRDIIQNDSALDEFLSLSSPNIQSELLDELYPLSLTALESSSSNIARDWRFQALALEVIAMQAKRYGLDFRVELIDALYPVLHLLGTPNPELQGHAMTCLNIIADACGYQSTSDLVVSNVDYIVNAIGLKLNYHDISPQAPQVLLMMLRLCGPSLLPYLDDLVGSMFSALERFHGYPKLVELLFAVLRGIAEEGIKSPQLLRLATSDPQESKADTSMAKIASLLKASRDEARLTDEDHQKNTEASFPRRAWKEEDEDDGLRNDSGETTEVQNDKSLQGAPNSAPNSAPSTPKTLDILLKVSDLTQHYLTSPSSSLRSSLLSLLHTTIPTLARHENTFLPLINTLWPVLLPRLEDPEAYIVSNALDTITLMCAHAGDFMKGRIEAAWPDLKVLYRRTSTRTANQGRLGSKSLHLNKSLVTTQDGLVSDLDHFRPELYTDTPTRMIHESFIRLFSTIAQAVAIREDEFDDLIDMLEQHLTKDDVREALERRNKDAVWLRNFQKKQHLAQDKGDHGVVDKVFRQIKPRSGHRWTVVEGSQRIAQ